MQNYYVLQFRFHIECQQSLSLFYQCHDGFIIMRYLDINDSYDDYLKHTFNWLHYTVDMCEMTIVFFLCVQNYYLRLFQ